MSTSTRYDFTLLAKPGTDIWRQPPSTDVDNTPTTNAIELPLTQFRSARLSFTFNPTTQYDHGGLLVSFYPKDSGTAATTRRKMWLKTGVEFYNSAPVMSTVVCDNWADWSVYPTTFPQGEEGWTVEIRREGGENGKGLWVYKIEKPSDGGTGEVKIPLREVCWFFANEEEWHIKIEVHAARPKKPDVLTESEDGDALKVGFWDFRVEKV